MPIKHKMKNRRSPRTHRRSRGDRGATMVEFAIVASVLFSLIFGIIEGAFAVQARNVVNNAVDEAARQAAVSGTDPDADWRVLNALLERRADQQVDIEYVVVFNASSPSSGLPDDCAAGTAGDNCNVYTPGFFDAPRENFGCDGGLGTQWCPGKRFNPDGSIGYVGVYVKAKYQPIIEQIAFDWALNFDVETVSIQAIETSGDLQRP